MRKNQPPNKEKDSPEGRVKKCGEVIQKALADYDCQMFTALKVGHAETPLMEVGGFPIVVKVAPNVSQA